MSYKGHRYAYHVVSKEPGKLAAEIDAVGNAFQNAGWIECEIIPDSGFPAQIVFAWTLDSKPVIPMIPEL